MHVETLADPRNSQDERRRLGEDVAEIERSDSEGEAINAFKRIRFGYWVPRRQEESYETSKIDSRDEVLPEQSLMEEVPTYEAEHLSTHNGISPAFAKHLAMRGPSSNFTDLEPFEQPQDLTSSIFGKHGINRNDPANRELVESYMDRIKYVTHDP